jgi:hypothetical protein
MAGGCCQLVGGLDLGIDGCIISVSTSCSVETAAVCGGEPLEGPATHSVSISAYAANEMWVGCPGKAGVNISWIRKYDCIANITYLIFAGQGQSFVAGDVKGLVSVNKALSSFSSFSASSSSGPTGIYMSTTQINGYGLNYAGDPFSFDTSNPDLQIDLGGSLGGSHYLQSFNFDAQPGQLPVVSYTFVAPIQGG